jgi:protein gp37
VWKLPYERDRELQHAGKTKIVFAGDLTDFFADTTVHNRLRPRAWDLIRDTPNTTYYVSTKVPRNLLKLGFLPDDWGTGYTNVMLVVSVTASNTLWRMDVLRDVPAKMRVVSFEPLWGSIKKVNPNGFDWFIVGGHSGPGYNEYPMRLEWAKELWDVAQDSKHVAYFFKQISAHSDEQGIDALDRLMFGRTYKKIRTRQWPELPFPMIPKAEKGHRFTDAEWEAFLAGTSPKPKLVQISA